MGLKDLFSRWTKGEDRRATERAERESDMTPYERDVDQEDFEARKDDIAAGSSWAGREAEGAASGELDD
jgi:transposase